jgi:hypothetical protein
MLKYTMDQAKRDFELGYLVKYEFHRVPLDKTGWLVVLSDGSNVGQLADARTKTPRVFKTLDAAINSVEQIGFSVDLLQ